VRDRDLQAVPARASAYWNAIRLRASELASDGCTLVADFYLDACLEHDVHWRTGKTLYGTPISTRQSNLRFRYVIQARSPFGLLSPMSWWRWAGVSIAGIFRNGRPATT
jgi:hypothetical protein